MALDAAAYVLRISSSRLKEFVRRRILGVPSGPRGRFVVSVSLLGGYIDYKS